MKTPRSPSGRTRGLSFIVPDDWTPDQALAVFELLDDLQSAPRRSRSPTALDLPRNQGHSLLRRFSGGYVIRATALTLLSASNDTAM